MRGPPTEIDRALERVRRAQKQVRQPEPFRIIITSDPGRPARTVVVPRKVPLLALCATTALILAALGFGFVSFQLRTGVNALQDRITTIVRAAEDVARYPWPRARDGRVTGAMLPSLRIPSGDLARFELESVNTGERLEVALDLTNGEVHPDSYRRLRRFMRCMRTTAETPLDPRLIETLYRLSVRTKQRIQIVSGFRAPMYSTADLSYHTRGMAADIRIPGMTPLMVRDLALSMGIKGVGYYPVSKFVHVDVRDSRFTWTDYGKDRPDEEGREHGPKPAAEPAQDVALSPP